jgi:hypothetical protein
MIDGMSPVPAALLLPALLFAAPPRHFELTASFVPAKSRSARAGVAVRFQPLDPDLKVNENPAPRLKLDADQSVLVDKQPPAAASVPDYDPLTARYLDTTQPVVFAVAVAKGAPRGEHSVRADVVYFYCSQRENWCRRATTEVTIPVTLR